MILDWEKLKLPLTNFAHYIPWQNELEKCYKHVIESKTDEYEKSLFITESFVEKLWEHLNIGHWKDVAVETRQLYSIASYVKAIILSNISKDGSYSVRALHCIDMAILLGASITVDGNDLLTNLAKDLHQQIPTENKINFGTDILKTSQKKLKYHSNVERIEIPSIERFMKNYFLPQQPVILTECLNHWPAMTNWHDLQYLMRIAGHRLVPIEIGKSYTTSEWQQKVIPFKEFLIDQFVSTNSTIKYLAQHNLFDQIIELKDDIRVPDYCALQHPAMEDCDVDDADIKSWFGPKGTISPMHFDPKNNLLCQIVGEKRIILASPEDSSNLYPHDHFLLSNTSEIDCENLDFDKFPNAKKCTFLQLTLAEGEMLYIPPKWWHYVRSISNSFSVSFWW